MRLTSARTPVPVALRRPLGLWIALGYTVLAVLVGIPSGVAMLLEQLPMEHLGEPMPAPDARRVGLLTLLNGIPAAVLAYGLWRQRPWTRPGLLGWMVVMNLASLAIYVPLYPPLGIAMGVLGLLVSIGVWLYLYCKPTVVAYYDSRRPAA